MTLSNMSSAVSKWGARLLLSFGIYALSSGPVLWTCQQLSPHLPGRTGELSLCLYIPLLFVCALDPSRVSLDLFFKYLSFWKVGFPV